MGSNAVTRPYMGLLRLPKVMQHPHHDQGPRFVPDAPQVTEKLGWKFLYARPRLPDTRGALCSRIEHGRWQVRRSAIRSCHSLPVVSARAECFFAPRCCYSGSCCTKSSSGRVSEDWRYLPQTVAIDVRPFNTASLRAMMATAPPNMLSRCLHTSQIVAIGFGKADMPPAGWEATKTFIGGLGVSDLSEVHLVSS